MIHIDGTDLIAQLDAHGWTQGVWQDDFGHICAHQAVRLCLPQPGDAHLIEQVADRQGWGTSWNDDSTTTEDMVRERLAHGIDVTDADLEETFGPRWQAVVEIVRKSAAMTEDEAKRLVAAWAAGDAWDAALAAAWDAEDAARVARVAARDAAWDAARAAGDAARAAWDAARAAWAAWDAAGAIVTWAIVTWDLATESGPYTTTMRDRLIAPWVSVCGMPEGLA